ncbi:MAG: hypothetical protein V4650_13785, partial [Pseudomonadota bacterium]
MMLHRPLSLATLLAAALATTPAAAQQMQRMQRLAPANTQHLQRAVAAEPAGVLRLLTAPDDAAVQWGDQAMPAAAAKQQLLQEITAGGERGVPERIGTPIGNFSSPEAIAQGNAQLRGYFFGQLDAEAFSAQRNSTQATNVVTNSALAERGNRSTMRRVGGNVGTAALSYRNDPAGWCAANGNTPRISRVLADGNRLTPDGEFALQGTCFGRARGTVQVTLPAPIGTLTLTPLEWADHKLLVKLPADLAGLVPTEARLTVLRADQVLSALSPMRFEPAWVEADVPSRYLRLLDCANPGTCTNFVGAPAGLLLPGLMHLLQPWAGSAPPRGVAALHISDAATAGRDVFHVQLPEWARVTGAAEVLRQGYPGLSTVNVQVGGDIGDLTRAPGERPAATVTVDWRMTGLVQRTSVSAFNLLTMGPLGAVRTDSFGYCHYTLNVKALVPRGV